MPGHMNVRSWHKAALRKDGKISNDRGSCVTGLQIMHFRKHSMSGMLQSPPHLPLQSLHNRPLHFLWRGHRCKTLERFTVAPDQELGKVPLDPPTQHAGQFVFQITKQRVRCATVDLNLFKHRKTHAVVNVTGL